MDNKFNRPFIVYRIESEVAYEGAIKICHFLLSVINCEKIYVEKLSSLNVDIIFKDNIKEKDKYKDKIEQFDFNVQKSNLCIILGGDGTILWAKNKYENKDFPPFLTFNLGKVGFFAHYSLEDYKDVLMETFNTDNYRLEKRQLLKAIIYGPGENFKEVVEDDKPSTEIGLYRRRNTLGLDEKSLVCLNDIVFDKGAGQKMIKLELKINGEDFTNILCDGLIFATPSGSSGYNLSTNGPIINYEVRCFVMNAIAPFTLSWRPLVFPEDFRIRVRNLTDQPMECTADGSIKLTMNKDNFADVTMSNKVLNFILLNKFIESGYNLWKDKLTGSLGWNILPGYASNP